jgi:fibronectin-binding autotransporter adhesin
MKQKILAVMAIALAGGMGLLAGRAEGATYYWDTDGNTSGFGDVAGTWGTIAFWSTNSTGDADTALTTITIGDGVNFGTATLALGSTASAVGVSGLVTVNSITFGSAQATAVTLSGGTSITLGGTSPAITVNNASNTISSVLAGSSFTKAGSGTLTLSGNNTHTGTTTISAGTLRLLGANMWKTARTYFINGGAVLHLDGGVEFFTGIAATTTIDGNGTLRLTGTYARGNDPGASLAMAMDSGGLIDVQSGATLQNGGWSCITWAGNQASMNVDGNFIFGDGNAVTVDALTGAGAMTKGWGTDTKTFTVGTAGGSGVFSGSIVYPPTGTIALSKVGAGTQTLAGNNTYNGGTTVSNGVLLVNGSITGTVSVVSGAYLGGTGAITGSVTYASGAFGLFTNDVPLRFTGPVTLNGNTVHLTLPDNLAEGTYLLATNTSSVFSGAFAATPVIDIGSAVTNCAISTDARSVRLIVSSTDTIAPTPDPMTFAVNPWALNTSTVVMTATTATDGFNPPVEYYFTNTVNGDATGWSTSTVWTNSGLTQGTIYGYQVKARDSATVPNETAFSSVFSAVPADPTITWDANNTGANQTDGAGTWLNANQWWNGITNSTWNNTIPNNAVIGNGNAGGTITLGTVTAGSVTMTNFTSTYTLTGGILTQSGGFTIAPTAGNVTLSTQLDGTGGLTKGGSGVLLFPNGGSTHTYAGPTIVTGGALQIGTGWNQGAQSLPGGISNNGNSGSNLEINGGNVRLAYYLMRALGAGPGQLQLTGGISGFSSCQGSTPGQNTIKLNNDLNYEIVWGSAYWNPAVLVLNDAAAGPTVQIELGNKINLNGATRTVSANSAAYPGLINGVIRHGSGTAGLTKTGPGELQLTANNTFNGPVTVNQGALTVSGINNVASANPLGQSTAVATNLSLANGTTLKYTGGAATCDRSFTINGTAAGHSATLNASGSGALNLTSTNTPAYGTGNQSRKLILTGTSTNTLAASIADNGSGQVSLTKTGAGTWVLTGNCRYSGDTVVTNGILRITGNRVLSPLTTVYLSTGSQTGTMDLAFAGTQMIAALYINGVKQPVGTPFGANDTTITGTGVLQCAGGGTLLMIE